MVLVLVIGDLHIPHRVHDLPAKFKKLLVPGKIQQILCTGNVCDRETYEYLRTSSFPLSVTVAHSPIRIGVIHGHQSVPTGDLDSLNAIARQLDVDVLVSGHTHTFQAVEYDGRFFVNPGSATGAWIGSYNGCVPLMWTVELYLINPHPQRYHAVIALMDIQGPAVVTYVYQLIEGEVRVEKIEYRKEPEPVREAPRPTAMPQSIPSSPGPQHVQSVW
ncbi:Metallo-dependent phosphatase [Cerioporus squamosus]|nr:Metallo-dependent phosphatase [Cerioporus squamosus]